MSLGDPLPLGSTIGILGGGQLGQMTAIAARRLGYRTAVLDPDPTSPGAQVADELIQGSLSDGAAIETLAQHAQVVTYEFENVSADAVAALERRVPVHPSSQLLRTSQHRIREKTAIQRLGGDVPPFCAVSSAADLEAALGVLHLPLVLKTATGGYDGKGQAVAATRAEARAACAELLAVSDTLIAEEQVDLALELSVICARDQQGRIATYPAAENRHVGGILDVTSAPARVSPAVAQQADAVARQLAVGLDLVGVLAVEMFVDQQGRVLVNEMAPRPHNSGHHTLEACATSQFEQLVRIVTGLPLGDTTMARPAAMANLLGDWWSPDGQLPVARMLAVPGVVLHLYGKASARPGRKMGHLTAVASTTEEAVARVLAARGERPTAP